MSVSTERRGSAFLVTIDRPERRNAIDGETADALEAALDAFEADDGAAVMVLTGAGREAFCAGADLKALESLDPDRPGGPLGFTRRTASKPTIAAIAGYAVAGGLELACWCDLRVAANDAVFGVFCRRWGVPLIDGGTVRLSRLIGHSHALDLILTGRGVAGAEAQMMGLANRLTEPGQALETAVALARELTTLPQVCLREDRLSSYEQWGLPLDAAIANELVHGLRVLNSGEAYEGASRFAGGAGRHGRPSA
jgi:enoyl-CoA hydratase